MRFRICACTDTSRALVGSSQTMNSGLEDRARAMEMRWRWPPENSCGYLRPSAGVSRTWRRRSPTRFSRSALSLERPKTRIGPAVAAGHVVAVEFDRARGRRIEPDHQPRHRRLAAARVAHQREGLALGDL